MSDGNQMISFSGCLFESNAAVGLGGSLGLNSADAGISIDMCGFRNNSADVAGERRYSRIPCALIYSAYYLMKYTHPVNPYFLVSSIVYLFNAI